MFNIYVVGALFPFDMWSVLFRVTNFVLSFLLITGVSRSKINFVLSSQSTCQCGLSCHYHAQTLRLIASVMKFRSCTTSNEGKAQQFNGSTSQKLQPSWSLGVWFWRVMWVRQWSKCGNKVCIQFLWIVTLSWCLSGRFLSSLGTDSRAMWQISLARQTVDSAFSPEA